MATLRRPVLLRNSKLAKKRRKVLYTKVAVLLFTIGGVISLLSYGAHREEVRIGEILVQGNNVVTVSELTHVIEEKLAGDYFFLFPKSNIFLYPKDAIEAAVLSAFTDIEKVSIAFESFKSIGVSVAERKPDSLWCGEAFVSSGVSVETYAATSTTPALSPCYFIDGDGFIFTQAPTFTGNVFFRFYGAIDEGASPVGQLFLDENKYRETNLFLSALTSTGITPVVFVVGEEDFELYLEDGTKIIFGKEQNLTTVLDNLESVLASDTFIESEHLDLEYIDLRFGNKVYYKLEE